MPKRPTWLWKCSGIPRIVQGQWYQSTKGEIYKILLWGPPFHIWIGATTRGYDNGAMEIERLVVVFGDYMPGVVILFYLPFYPKPCADFAWDIPNNRLNYAALKPETERGWSLTPNRRCTSNIGIQKLVPLTKFPMPGGQLTASNRIQNISYKMNGNKKI